jgi:two-component system, cell cycle sensor histidine kinase and response regulator CckA
MSKKILVVDNDRLILELMSDVLEKEGHEVLTAKVGKEAIQVYETNRDRIDMVILDMIMPEMGGGDTYDRLKEINPDIKVLLSSGYSIDGQAKEILERGCDGFIPKPFNMEQLSRKIREILDN